MSSIIAVSLSVINILPRNSNSVLAEILKVPPDEKSADGSESRLLSRGKYGDDDVFSWIKIFTNKFSTSSVFYNDVNFSLFNYLMSRFCILIPLKSYLKQIFCSPYLLISSTFLKPDHSFLMNVSPIKSLL